MSNTQQLSFYSPDTQERVAAHIRAILNDDRQPSARELVGELDRTIGIVARWDPESVLVCLLTDKDLTHAGRAYLASLLEGEDLLQALRGEKAPDQKRLSTIDALLYRCLWRLTEIKRTARVRFGSKAEVKTFHTSSARSKKDSRTERPRALAAFRLTAQCTSACPLWANSGHSSPIRSVVAVPTAGSEKAHPGHLRCF